MYTHTGNSPTVVSAVSSSMDDPPTNLTAITQSVTSIIVTWDPPESANMDANITYNVSYDAIEGFVNGISLITNLTMIPLDNLEEGVQYFIMVETLYNDIPCGITGINATTYVAGK